jgi:outer membrane protein OmpA-like peptidoglycan-associated protein
LAWMRNWSFPVFLLALALPLGVSRLVYADGEGSNRKKVFSVEVSAAIPLGPPQSLRFRPGIMPSVSAAVSLGQHVLLGARLRAGVLFDGDPPEDPGLKDPGKGGLVSLLGMIRVLDVARPASRALGLYLDMGVGPGVTGYLIRPVGEIGVGYGILLGGMKVAPTARYLHIMQWGNALDNTDAKVLLLGVEVGSVKKPAPRAEEPETVVEAEKIPEVERDTDGDGLPDAIDKCPTEPEDKDGFQDLDGCPDPDNDKDGILDLADKCPNEPETMNGIEDGDGCPDQGVIELKEERLSYEERVLFATNRARVLPAGRPILEAIVHMWKQHPEWERLVIEGHTDKRGPHEFNNWLSKERAERTRRMLVDMGFPPDKVEVAGYGDRVPRKEGDSEADYQANRRVEFVIVRKTQVPAAPVAPEGSTAPPSTEPMPEPGPMEPPPAAPELEPPPQ